MKKRFIYLVVSALFVVPAIQIHAQSFKGLFDKEEAVFHVSVTPTAESGVAMVTLYFTHSKATTLEASLWVKDLGTNLSPVGGNRLVKDLWEMSNRKQDTIYIEGLTNLHFYTIGLDFRTPQGLTPRFNTKILSDSYRYEYLEKKQTPAGNAKVKTAEKTAQPCETPDISVRAEAEGYCGAENRPAVVIECLNCTGKSWTFRVEYSSNATSWKSLRSDGKSQTANGNAIRTEPLCILPDGEYKLRVSATGENCTTPVYHYLGTPLHIGGQAAAPAEIQNNENPVLTQAAPLPDTCAVMAEAILIGNEIRGQVTLPSGSPCGDHQPYAQVRYVHPGHRDQNIGQVPLNAGKATPFQFDLDAFDLKRSIHTLQIVVFASAGPGKSAQPISTSWIKAESRQDGFAMHDANVRAKGFEEPARKNYTRLQDLRPVYLSVQSDVPAYIAWTNPAECINGGCAYTVWAGKSNGPIRLLAKGKQGGSLVKESLAGLTIEERYLEVEVETKSGSSIASYVFGQGPNFNFGENYVHRERIMPAAGKPETAPRDMLVAQPTPTPVDQLVAKGKVQNSEALVREETMTEKPERKMVAGSSVVFEQPQLPVSTFNSCKYQREISVVGDMPINAGDWMVIKYNFSEPGYKYTLYFQPEGQTEWFITPGTKELQDKPEFYLEMTRYHTGRYAVLAYSFQNRWGCLSTPLSEALLIKVEQ